MCVHKIHHQLRFPSSLCGETRSQRQLCSAFSSTSYVLRTITDPCAIILINETIHETESVIGESILAHANNPVWNLKLSHRLVSPNQRSDKRPCRATPRSEDHCKDPLCGIVALPGCVSRQGCAELAVYRSPEVDAADEATVPGTLNRCIR